MGTRRASRGRPGRELRRFWAQVWTSLGTFLVVFALFFSCLLSQAPALAADIRGKVTAVLGKNIEVGFNATARPRAGDTVEVSFSAGGMTIPVGTWRVTEVGTGRLRAAPVKVEGPPNIDMLAVIRTRSAAKPPHPSDPASVYPPSASSARMDIPPPASTPPPPPPVNMLAVQVRLLQLGFDPGRIDGKGGAKTRAAVHALQKSQGLSQTGMPTRRLLNHMDGMAVTLADNSVLAQVPTASLTKLALIYYFGKEVRRNFAQSRIFSLAGAERGDSGAMEVLGYIYRYGSPRVKKDLGKSLHWFLKAGDAGHGSSLNEVGRIYLKGWGVPKDSVKAREYFRKADDKGNHWGPTNMGITYLKGLGVPKDPEKAVPWLKKGAERSNSRAMYELGLLYLNGSGVAMDDAAARRWLQQAAYGNHVEANYILGLIYETGRGVLQDKREALLWYRRAAKLKHPQAMQAIDRITHQRK